MKIVTQEEKNKLKKLIDVATGKIQADLVIKNAKVVNVFTAEITKNDIAICDGKIAGVGTYEGREEFDASGKFAAPGFIESHVHIESSMLSPEELGFIVVPYGTTTMMADPHEIMNVAGINGLKYMMDASSHTALDIKYLLPSCVPATPFETSGSAIDAEDMNILLSNDEILGLGEFMNVPGVLAKDERVLDKILVAKKHRKIIDGHCVGILGKNLAGYASVGILANHESTNVEEMHQTMANGLYVLLRQGSASQNLRTLLKGVTSENSRRCALCSDDIQPKTILEKGYMNLYLADCVANGVSAITAIRMATLNPSECFGLKDRGAIAPGRRADITLLDDLEDFVVDAVFIEGKLVARKGKYLLPVTKQDISPVMGSVVLKNFSKAKLKMNLKSNYVNAIEMQAGVLVTKKVPVYVLLDAEGNFIYDPAKDIVKIAVVERHKGSGRVACAFLKGYGIKHGAIACSIAHDSHNISVAGVNDDDMALAVKTLEEIQGGIVLVRDGLVIESMSLPIAGLMSDKSADYVIRKLQCIHEIAHKELKIKEDLDPTMILSFMALPVIPDIKLTDKGLFDVTTMSFISIYADE